MAHRSECGLPSAESLNCLVSPSSQESMPFPQSSLCIKYLVVTSLAVHSTCLLQCRQGDTVQDDKPFQKLLEYIEINETKVKKLLQKLKLNKSPGSDEIHNKVLYEIKEEIVTPLTDLFRESLESGVLPKEWKVANITPIFKKGKKQIQTIIDQSA